MSASCSPSRGGRRRTPAGVALSVVTGRTVRTPSTSTHGSSPSASANANASPTSLMGPAGTPAPPRRATHSAASASANAASSSAVRSSRCSRRSRFVAKRASSASPGRADGAAQPPEQRVVAAGDREVGVGGAVGLVRGDARVAVAEPAGHDARVEEARALVEERRERAVHERDLDALALARARAGVQRGEDPVGGEQPADHVHERRADLQRPPVGLAGHLIRPLIACSSRS